MNYFDNLSFPPGSEDIQFYIFTSVIQFHNFHLSSMRQGGPYISNTSFMDTLGPFGILRICLVCSVPVFLFGTIDLGWQNTFNLGIHRFSDCWAFFNIQPYLKMRSMDDNLS